MKVEQRVTGKGSQFTFIHQLTAAIKESPERSYKNRKGIYHSTTTRIATISSNAAFKRRENS